MDRGPVTALDGILVVDKPGGRSSAGAADDARKIVGATRVGHGGTLDPMATGVLVVCLGQGTKLATYMLADDKAYEADLVLGVETDTLDRTGKVVAEHAVPATIDEAAVRTALARFLGEQDQIPPMYSAIKQGGVRLYEHARRGEEVVRPPRRIRIDRLELVAFASPTVRIAIACSKGTYVRSLVADLGTTLGTGAHLAGLRRTRSGRFTIAEAVTLDALRAMTREQVATHMIPLAAATDLPSVVFPAAMYDRVVNGVQVEPAVFGPTTLGLERFQLVDEAGVLTAVVHVEANRVLFDRVFKFDKA